jgi:hypothetical protein
MIECGFNDDNNSVPDVEFMYTNDDYILGNEEEKQSTNSKSSFKGYQ